MEQIKKRYKMALQTLATLKEVLDKIEQGVPEEYVLEMRDSAIQRFEYSIDTFWKFHSCSFLVTGRFCKNNTTSRCRYRL